jgi:hypothetical protein
MVKEFFKLTAGASPGPVLSPVSSLEAPQLNVRGPAGNVKGDDQGDGQPPGNFSHVCSSLEAPQLDFFLSLHDGLLGEQGEGVHEEGGVGEQKNCIFLESLTFYPTYFKIDTLASKTKKWEEISFPHLN